MKPTGSDPGSKGNPGTRNSATLNPLSQGCKSKLMGVGAMVAGDTDSHYGVVLMGYLYFVKPGITTRSGNAPIKGCDTAMLRSLWGNRFDLNPGSIKILDR